VEPFIHFADRCEVSRESAKKARGAMVSALKPANDHAKWTPSRILPQARPIPALRGAFPKK
jgi:hypothetical protein